MNLSELKYSVLRNEQIHLYYFWFYFILDIIINFLVIVLIPILNFFVFFEGRYILFVVGGLTGIQNIVLRTTEFKIQHEIAYKSYIELKSEIYNMEEQENSVRDYILKFNIIQKTSPRIYFFGFIPRKFQHTEEEIYQIERQFNI